MSKSKYALLRSLFETDSIQDFGRRQSISIGLGCVADYQLATMLTQSEGGSVSIWLFCHCHGSCPATSQWRILAMCATVTTSNSDSEGCRCLGTLRQHRCARMTGRIGPLIDNQACRRHRHRRMITRMRYRMTDQPRSTQYALHTRSLANWSDCRMGNQGETQKRTKERFDSHRQGWSESGRLVEPERLVKKGHD